MSVPDTSEFPREAPRPRMSLLAALSAVLGILAFSYLILEDTLDGFTIYMALRPWVFWVSLAAIALGIAALWKRASRKKPLDRALRKWPLHVDPGFARGVIVSCSVNATIKQVWALVLVIRVLTSVLPSAPRSGFTRQVCLFPVQRTGVTIPDCRFCRTVRKMRTLVSGKSLTRPMKSTSSRMTASRRVAIRRHERRVGRFHQLAVSAGTSSAWSLSERSDIW